ncbi:Hypothetical predicted protein, partial [Olea europaea subsp. europaea]
MFVNWLKEVLKGYGKFWGSNWALGCLIQVSRLHTVWNQDGLETRHLSAIHTVLGRSRCYLLTAQLSLEHRTSDARLPLEQ